MRFGSVCSGIEAASVAWHPLGWTAAWFSEIEPFPCAVLAHHYPSVPNVGDMTQLPRKILQGDVEAPDVFTGGTPCQAFSVAGLRQSLDDDRGNLTLKFVEIADAIDHVRGRAGREPSIIVWENVPGVLSTKDNAFGCFLAGLAGEDGAVQPPGNKWTDAGCVYGPTRSIAWRTLDAQHFGLAQRRRRVFVVASAREDFDPAQILLEWASVRRDSAPSREAGERAADGAAPCLDASFGRLQGCSGQDSNHGHGHLIPQAFGGNNTAGPIDVATACNAHGGAKGRLDFESETFVTQAHAFDARQSDVIQYGDKTGPLDTDGHSVGVLAWQPGNVTRGAGSAPSTEVFPTLKSDHGRGASDQQPHVLAFDTTQITSAANYSNPQPGDPCHPLAAGAHAPAIAVRTANTSANGHGISDELAHTLDRAQGQAVAFHPTQDPISSTDVCHSIGANDNATAAVCFDDPRRFNGPHGGFEHGDIHPTLENTNPKQIALTAMQVRRLTPVECERLQGFPDHYTAIPWRGKPASECPDGPRYKALGNSWAVPVVRWIGQRIDGAA